MIDTHCHVQFNAYKEDAEKVIKKCADLGVVLNVVGTQKDTNERAVELVEKYDHVYATVGLHPIHLNSTEVDEEETSFRSREEDFDYEFYKKLATHPKVIGIGECGLELFHLPKGADEKSILEKQKEVFIAQYKLAGELDLPIIIHVRDAHEEMIELLSTLTTPSSPPSKGGDSVSPSRLSPPYEGGALGGGPGKINGVIHCYSSNWADAEKYLKLGLHIGFTGIITFPPKKTDPETHLELLRVVEKCPLDRILIETDSPYLAPQAYRGQRCEPWMVEEVAKKIAEIRGLSLGEIVKTTEENARRLFKKIKS